MKAALACFLLCALPARASDVPPPELDVRIVKVAIVRDPHGVGEIEVTGGCHIDGPSCIAKARERAACCARADRLEKGITLPLPLLIGVAVVSAAAAAVVTHAAHGGFK